MLILQYNTGFYVDFSDLNLPRRGPPPPLNRVWVYDDDTTAALLARINASSSEEFNSLYILQGGSLKSVLYP